METPDPYTLVINLTSPTGDLRLPVRDGAPPRRSRRTARRRLGAAEGHTRDYGRFLVATGPYSSPGAEDLDFSLPAEEQAPVAGYEPGQSIQLGAQPVLRPGDRRPAARVPGPIEVTIGGDNNDLYNKINAGELDCVVDGIVPPQVLRSYSTDPTLQPRLHIYPSDAVRYISFNMAEPPFDDINVRKAVNYALDKEGMRQLRGGESAG